MRLFTTILFAIFAVTLARPPPLKTVVVSYPNDTPASVVYKAIEEVKQAGGIITHEYSLIKGFAAKMSDRMIETVNTLTNDYHPYIEDDSIITISNSH